MAGNYQETQVSGTQWKRACRVNVINPYGGAGRINFTEETLMHLGDSIITLPSSPITNPLLETRFDPAGSFPEINPETGEPTGNTISHMQLYVALHSLYIHLAKQRDEAAVGGGE